MGRSRGGGRRGRGAGEGGRSRGRGCGPVTGLEGAERGSGAAGRPAWAPGRRCGASPSAERPGRPAASAGLGSSGLPVPCSALHQPSAPPRAARPRSVRGPADPSLSRRVCAHCSCEPAGPAQLEASRSLPPSAPSPPIVVGIGVPTGNVAMPPSPRKVGKGIRQSGGRRGWTEEAMQREGACWMLARWEEGWCGLDVQRTRITLAAILGG